MLEENHHQFFVRPVKFGKMYCVTKCRCFNYVFLLLFSMLDFPLDGNNLGLPLKSGIISIINGSRVCC